LIEKKGMGAAEDSSAKASFHQRSFSLNPEELGSKGKIAATDKTATIMTTTEASPSQSSFGRQSTRSKERISASDERKLTLKEDLPARRSSFPCSAPVDRWANASPKTVNSEDSFLLTPKRKKSRTKRTPKRPHKASSLDAKAIASILESETPLLISKLPSEDDVPARRASEGEAPSLNERPAVSPTLSSSKDLSPSSPIREQSMTKTTPKKIQKAASFDQTANVSMLQRETLRSLSPVPKVASRGDAQTPTSPSPRCASLDRWIMASSKTLYSDDWSLLAPQSEKSTTEIVNKEKTRTLRRTTSLDPTAIASIHQRGTALSSKSRSSSRRSTSLNRRATTTSCAEDGLLLSPINKKSKSKRTPMKLQRASSLDPIICATPRPLKRTASLNQSVLHSKLKVEEPLILKRRDSSIIKERGCGVPSMIPPPKTSIGSPPSPMHKFPKDSPCKKQRQLLASPDSVISGESKKHTQIRIKKQLRRGSTSKRLPFEIEMDREDSIIMSTDFDESEMNDIVSPLVSMSGGSSNNGSSRRRLSLPAFTTLSTPVPFGMGGDHNTFYQRTPIGVETERSSLLLSSMDKNHNEEEGTDDFKPMEEPEGENRLSSIGSREDICTVPKSGPYLVDMHAFKGVEVMPGQDYASPYKPNGQDTRVMDLNESERQDFITQAMPMGGKSTTSAFFSPTLTTTATTTMALAEATPTIVLDPEASREAYAIARVTAAVPTCTDGTGHKLGEHLTT